MIGDTMIPMTAFYGDADLKAQMLAIVAEHRLADQLVQGFTYWDDDKHKGCAVGCSLESYRKIKGLSMINHASHKLYEVHLGVPQALARLEDGIFESLPKRGGWRK